MPYKILPAEKILKSLRDSLASIHTGLVNSSTLDSLTVVLGYGDQKYTSKIVELASITVPETRQLLITPYDKGTLAAIDDCIRKSTLGVNPVNNGVGLRLVFPMPTEDNRRNRTKDVSARETEAKAAVKKWRQDIREDMKAKQKAGEISEDDLKRFEDALQKEVDSLNKEIESICAAKIEDIMKL